MSTSELPGKPPLPHRLVVPYVRTGDIGLVLTVCKVGWDGEHWWLIDAAGRLYVLPAPLRGWARLLDYDVRRRTVELPAVFAFSQQATGMRVREMSVVQAAR